MVKITILLGSQTGSFSAMRDANPNQTKVTPRSSRVLSIFIDNFCDGDLSTHRPRQSVKINSNNKKMQVLLERLQHPHTRSDSKKSLRFRKVIDIAKMLFHNFSIGTLIRKLQQLVKIYSFSCILG